MLNKPIHKVLFAGVERGGIGECCAPHSLLITATSDSYNKNNQGQLAHRSTSQFGCMGWPTLRWLFHGKIRRVMVFKAEYTSPMQYTDGMGAQGIISKTIIRIPIKQPGFNGSSIRPFFFSLLRVVSWPKNILKNIKQENPLSIHRDPLTSWWFQPIWKRLVMGNLPQINGENNKCLEKGKYPPPGFQWQI